MPPLPSWNGIHPLVVHFPIALLTVAPLLVVIGLAARSHRAFFLSALLLMALGAGGSWLAVASGEAASQLAERVPGVAPLLKHHEEMAETTRALFTALTLGYAAMLAIAWVLRPNLRFTAVLGACAVFLAGYSAALVYMANTAHQGARLVHEMGVHAPLMAVSTPRVPPAGGGDENLRRGEGDD